MYSFYPYFLVLFATAIAFFIFSGVFYSHGAFKISPTTFILMGVTPHVWGEVLPWLNIFATLAIYILFWVAYKFFKYNFAPDEQDEVSTAHIKRYSNNTSSYRFKSKRNKS